MKSPDMRDMTLEELRVQHDQFMDELTNLRVKLALRQLDNPIRVRHLRRNIARARTILVEKESGARPGETPAATA